jgi:hypothetical protein
MEIWQILLIIVGIASMFILISLTYRFLEFQQFPEKMKIEGEKGYVVDILAKFIYKCWERFKGKSESVICAYLTIKSNEDISSSDVLNNLNPLKIDKSLVKVDDLASFSEVVIRYENKKIYVERIEHERISS